MSDTAAVLAVLKPIWNGTQETASRVRGRIESVLDYAKAHKLRQGENPAAWRGHLALILPKHGKLGRSHFAAMDYADVPAFLAVLRSMKSFAAAALEFTILTACRSGEVLGARWSEVDLEVWTIPANRMKSGVEHRVPLSEPAVSILTRMASIRSNNFVFPGRHGVLSVTAMGRVLVKAGAEGVTIHGFRSSFSSWAADCTMFQREVIESALAHAVGNAVEQAYRRTVALEKRRALMNDWAKFLEGAATGNVVKLASAHSHM